MESYWEGLESRNTNPYQPEGGKQNINQDEMARGTCHHAYSIDTSKHVSLQLAILMLDIVGVDVKLPINPSYNTSLATSWEQDTPSKAYYY